MRLFARFPRTTLPSSLQGWTPLLLSTPLRLQSSSRDFYQTLGVSPNASQDEIKSAYKKLALEFHPDRNKAPEAEEKFKTISEAYSVVGNKTKRKDYDASRSYGTAGSASSYHQSSYDGGQGGPRPSNPFGGANVRYQNISKEEADRLFRDIFGGMQVDQIFRDMDQQMRRTQGSGNPFYHSRQSPVNRDFGSNSSFRPFFRKDSFHVTEDEYGNRVQEGTYTSANGTKYTVRNFSSQQPGASTNQTTEEFYDNAARNTTAQDNRFRFSNTSFRVNPKERSNDFGQYFGVRTHGRSYWGIAVIIAWSVVVFTIIFASLNFAFTHPIFLLAVLVLLYSRRMF